MEWSGKRNDFLNIVTRDSVMQISISVMLMRDLAGIGAYKGVSRIYLSP